MLYSIMLSELTDKTSVSSSGNQSLILIKGLMVLLLASVLFHPSTSGKYFDSSFCISMSGLSLGGCHLWITNGNLPSKEKIGFKRVIKIKVRNIGEATKDSSRLVTSCHIVLQVSWGAALRTSLHWWAPGSTPSSFSRDWGRGLTFSIVLFLRP